MGVSLNCMECQVKSGQQSFDRLVYFKTMKEIEQKLNKYVQDNMLFLYVPRHQKLIQKLFTLGQVHISDLLIKLTSDKQFEKRDRLVQQIQHIDLEELDHISIIQRGGHSFFMVQLAQDETEIQQEVSSKSSKIRSTIPGHEIKNNLLKSRAKQMKIINKYSIKDNQMYLKAGISIIQNNNALFIVPIQCFTGIGCLTPLSLPTKKTPLFLFLEKVQAINKKYGSKLMLMFLINPQFQELFDKQLQNYFQESNLLQGDSSYYELTRQYFKSIKILYKPFYPCINRYRQIQILQNQRLDFIYIKGDLIGFLQKDIEAKNIIKRYVYCQFINLQNILEKFGDQYAFGLMELNKQIDILAKIIKIDHLENNMWNLQINQKFIQNKIILKNFNHSNNFKLTQSYFFRTQILTDDHNSFTKIISSRLKAEELESNKYNFVRHFQDILYEPRTLLLTVQAGNQFCQRQNRQYKYSNYCKKILGFMNQTEDNQFVQICPQVLYGKKDGLKQVIDSLKNLEKIGFPLIINTEKLQINQNEKK